MPSESKSTTAFFGIGGKVRFDFGEINLGKIESIPISGEFPRIKPRCSRENIKPEEMQLLSSKLNSWVDAFYDRSSAPKYWTNLVDVVSMFAAYTDPFHQLDSVEMELAAKTFAWFWHADDILERAIAAQISPNIIESGTSQLFQIFQGKKQRFTPVEGSPEFFRLYASLQNIQNRLEAHDHEYLARSKPFQKFARRYFDAMKWYSVAKIDGTYSEETFVYWRRVIAYFDGIAEITYLQCRGQLPKKVLKSPLLRRILDIANSVGAFVNDLIGLRKELQNGEQDNLVIFKTFQKGVPLEQAVEEVCQFLTKELHDFVLLRDAILKEFPNEPCLVQYIDVLESLMDGHNMIYNYSARHVSTGTVSLS